MNMRNLHPCLGAALCIFAAVSVHGAEIKGSVSEANGGLAKITVLSELVPNVGDAVRIYFIIPGGEDEVAVAKGRVAGIEGDSVSVKVEDAAGTVAKGQLAMFTSDKPGKKTFVSPPVPPIPPTSPIVITPGTPTVPPTTPFPPPVTPLAPMAETPPDLTGRGPHLLTFDPFQIGAELPGNILKFAGGRVAASNGIPMADAAGPEMVLPPGRKQVMLIHGGPETLLSLVFDPPLKRFSMTRIGVIKGASVPTWRLESFDAQGNKLEAVGEQHGLYPQPRTVALARGTISRVVLTTDNRHGKTVWATYNALPVAEIAMER